MTTWIVVRNWDRFQHYGDKRTPPWIKLYVQLVHDDDFQSLSPADRSALIGLWMIYAMTRRRVRLDTAKLSRSIGQRITKQTLERLNRAGFIEFAASTPLALEVEVEVEKSSLREKSKNQTAENGNEEAEKYLGHEIANDLIRKWLDTHKMPS